MNFYSTYYAMQTPLYTLFLCQEKIQFDKLQEPQNKQHYWIFLIKSLK